MMGKNIETNIVLTGLVRDESKLINKLNQFQNWQQRGLVSGVYISTWIGEIDKYPGLRNKLMAYDLTLLELEEPKLVLKGGHQLHQMLTLHYGLEAITNKESYVLKTRVDLADNIEAMTWEFGNGLPESEDFLNIGIEKKILVEYSQLLFPFLMGDAQFFGKLKDLRLLVNLSTEMELLYSRLAVEQTFFFNPFREIGLFKDFFYWNLPHIADQNIKRPAQLAAIANSQYFQNIISSWLLVTDSYFKVGWGSDQGEKKSFSIEAALASDDLLLQGPDGSFLIQKSSEVRALLNSISPTKVARLKRSLLAQGAGPFNISDNIYKELENFRKNYSTLSSARVGKINRKRTLTIRGVVQHLFVADSDSALESYRNQVTYLRRENDALQRRIGMTARQSWIHSQLIKSIDIRTLEKMKTKFPKLFDAYQKYVWWK